MKDTAFFPTEDRMPRVVTLYERKPNGLSRTDTPAWLATKTLFSGGGGLWSTPEDYMQFAQMLVNGGELNGKRLLSPRTVDLMASNHVGDLYTGVGQRLQGMGFGLTVEVVMDGVVGEPARVERQLRLGRRLRHALLGRSQGAAGRPADGAGVRTVS